MIERCRGLVVIINHPQRGTLNSAEFGDRCVGVVTLGYVKDGELWGVARILDNAVNELLSAGAIDDTSPCAVFEPGSGQRITVDDHELFVEPPPSLLDHLALCPRGVWSRDAEPSGVENELSEAA